MLLSNVSPIDLVCLGCGRGQSDSARGERCGCGARNWADPTRRADDVDLALVCLSCGERGRIRALGGWCACGARSWLNTAPKTSPSPPSPSRSSSPPPDPRPPPIDNELRPLGSDNARRLIIDHYPGSAIATALEGIAREMVIMLAGTAGAGKSTLAAQAGFAIAQKTGGALYWLDADQLKEELIQEAFVRARCPPEQLAGRIFPVHEAGENGLPDFRRACSRVPGDGVMVVDSLESWAPRGDKQALEWLRLLRAHPSRVKLVIAATNASGGVAGDGELERACDATVFVERDQLRVGKCRWAIGATWRRLGPGGLMVARAEEQEPAGSPNLNLESSDMRPSASVMSTRERSALAKVLQRWPSTWPFLTARAIIEAIEREAVHDLRGALCELALVEALTPSNLGYALRWVKHRPIGGKMLSSTLDRRAKIARWNVVQAA